MKCTKMQLSENFEKSKFIKFLQILGCLFFWSHGMIITFCKKTEDFQLIFLAFYV